MGQRLQLQALLEAFPGVNGVYFQEPPANMMQYPCIVYALDKRETSFANNLPYRSLKRYIVTIIDKNPDSMIPDMVADLPTSAFSRSFRANNLNHQVFTLYF